MPKVSIQSPAGPLSTLEEYVALARGLPGGLESRFVDPVLLVVAPSEGWADTTSIRHRAEGGVISVKMLPTLVIPVKGDGEITFGRGPQNQVILPFAAMSKSHGVLTHTAEGWSIRDTGSKNGSFIDGGRIETNVTKPMRDGASLRFGDVTAKFMEAATFRNDLKRRLQEAPPPPPAV